MKNVIEIKDLKKVYPKFTLDIDKLNIKNSFISLIPTVIYSIVLIILNIVNVVDGPYPFLKVCNQSVLTSILWVIIIYAIVFVVSHFLRTLHNKCRS